MNRREFLKALGIGLPAAAAVTYFDMGPAWKRHESGLITPSGSFAGVGDYAALLKEIYRDEAVYGLTYQGRPLFEAVASRASRPGRRSP